MNPHERALEAAARALIACRHEDDDTPDVVMPTTDYDRDLARAAVSAYLAEAGDGWRGIETAPKDGTRVMLWMEPMNDARFAPTDGPHAVFGTWVVWSDAMKREGMRDGWSWYGSPLHWPTHWAPLPAPPVQEKK